MQLHSATKILLWLVFAISIPWLSPLMLLVSSGMLLLLLLRKGAREFARLLRRSRWLLLSLFLIYAITTSGNALLPALGIFSPTREGLHSGSLQAWRLAVILAALSVLLAAASREQLLGGIYVLLRPLKIPGVNAERIAARLWLTLHYAEQLAADRQQGWRQKLHHALEPHTPASSSIALQLEIFSWRDLAAVATALALAGYLLL